MTTTVLTNHATVHVTENLASTCITINGHYLKENIEITFLDGGIRGIIGPNITVTAKEILDFVHANAIMDNQKRIEIIQRL